MKNTHDNYFIDQSDEGYFIICSKGGEKFSAGYYQPHVVELIKKLNNAHRANVRQVNMHEILVCWNDHVKSDVCEYVMELGKINVTDLDNHVKIDAKDISPATCIVIAANKIDQSESELKESEELKLVLSDDRVLTIDEKAMADTMKLMRSAQNSKLGLSNMIKAINKDESEGKQSARPFLKSSFLPKGRKVYLELEVMDSLLSGLLNEWLHCKSEDGGRLHVMGCVLNSISNVPHGGLTDEQKSMIDRLNESINGKN